jgi:K+-transporting ATPase ATPase A chain
MATNIIIQIGLYLLLLCLLTKPMGLWINAVMTGEKHLLSRIGEPVERFFYKLAGVDVNTEMTWKHYTIALMSFNILGVMVVFLLQKLQLALPLNPQQLTNISTDSAFNTAISFVTNTNWQGYAGETTMSYFSQMLALTVQNFFSAATGIAVAIALIRGFSRHSSQTIGNFWVDVTRSTLYLLLPLSLLLAVSFMGQGVIQNFDAYQNISTLNHGTQTLAMGPVASQEAIKMLGTNGGGFFNANSAHPFENPTPLVNFLQMLAIFIIPAGLCYAFGVMVGDRRQGWAIFGAMMLIFIAFLSVEVVFEQQGNPLLTTAGADQQLSALQAGGNMEG